MHTKVLKLPLEVHKSNAHILDGQSKICNWIYNNLLEKSIQLRAEYTQTQNPETGKILYTERGLRNLIPILKMDHTFLRSVHSSPLKNAALRLSESIQSHQKSKKGKRRGKITGWPRFRSWKESWFSLLYDEPYKRYKIVDNTLILSLGSGEENKRHSIKIPIQDTSILNKDQVRNMRIVKQLGVYYAVFTVQVELPKQKEIKRIIAFDPNHKNLAYGVDPEGKSIEIAAPYWLKNYDKRMDQLKSKRDQCVK